MSDHKLNHFVNRAIPPNIAEDNPLFKTFVEKYFEYLSRELGEYDVAAKLLDYANIDKTIDTFYDSFKMEYVPLLPEKYKASLSTIVKNAGKFYQTKGTEESFKSFFRMIFDTTVELYYPKVDMLRCSDGKWTEPYYLTPLNETFEDLQYFFDKNVTGSVSGAFAYVESITQITDPDDINAKIFAVSLVDLVGVFNVGDTITVTGENTPSFVLDTSGTKGIITGQGYWKGTDGFLSWNKYVQDSDYYQDYSYVLESPISVELYEKPIKENLHPSGLKFFGRVAEGITLVDIGDALAAYIDDIIIWFNLELVETTVSGITQVLSNIQQGTNIANANNFDWRYFEQNREATPIDQLYPIGSIGELPIAYVSDNYAENFLDVVVDGSSTTAYSILNEQIILDVPLGSDQVIVVTTTDQGVPLNSRTYRIQGATGQDTFYLPNVIRRMEFAGELADVII